MSSMITLGSLYLVALAQAGAPHVKLMIPIDETKGKLIHIKVPDDDPAQWTFEIRTERIINSIFLTTMLQIHDGSKDMISIEEVKEAQKEVPAPGGRQFGKCLPWAIDLVKELASVIS